MLLVVAPAGACAQGVVAQGQGQVQGYGQGRVQGYGQPRGVPQAPPGYDYPQQSYGQPTYPSAQPAYGTPTYAPTYGPSYPARPRQVRYEQRESTIKGLWIPGAIVFGASWALSGSVASLSPDGDYQTYAWIPLVGPWLMLTVASSDSETAGALVAGVTQLAGAVMLVLGLSLHDTIRVAVYALGDRPRSPQLALELRPALAGATFRATLTHF